jgi:protein O-mannosyl-transferase
MGVRELRLPQIDRRHFALLAGCAVLAAVAMLYLPFLSNPYVFDDRAHFIGTDFAKYASFPFGLAPRFPASFSVAFIEVLFGSVQAHRIVSLALHAGVACALFMLIRLLQRAAAAPLQNDRWLAALAVALLFAVHPVAVYGAAYLAQRSMVLATLFSVLSAVVFVHGLLAGRYAASIAAAALYSLAVLCNEKAIVALAAVPLCAWIVTAPRRFTVRYTLLYIAASLPAALFIFLLMKGIAGNAYQAQEALPVEKAAVTAASQWLTDAGSPWLSSVLTQLNLFPRYIALWLWPETSRMSFDLRVDFAYAQAPIVAAISLTAFIGAGVAGAWLVLRRGRLAMVGFGILWFWLLYLIEFSVARFQDPFVLYRSYLWAPGVAVAVAAVVERFSPRVALAGAAILVLALGVQAHDRLRTFSSGLALWEDAVAKLPPGSVPGGSRALYQLGREYFYAGNTEKAAAVVDRCIADYPGVHQCLLARAAMAVAQEQYETALPYLARAIAARPNDGVSRHHLGLALQGIGCFEEARAQYRLAVDFSFWGGVERLKSLDREGGGILPGAKLRPAAEPSRCADALKGIAPPPG